VVESHRLPTGLVQHETNRSQLTLVIDQGQGGWTRLAGTHHRGLFTQHQVNMDKNARGQIALYYIAGSLGRCHHCCCCVGLDEPTRWSGLACLSDVLQAQQTINYLEVLGSHACFETSCLLHKHLC
jgi:hypothetical protein